MYVSLREAKGHGRAGYIYVGGRQRRWQGEEEIKTGQKLGYEEEN